VSADDRAVGADDCRPEQFGAGRGAWGRAQRPRRLGLKPPRRLLGRRLVGGFLLALGSARSLLPVPVRPSEFDAERESVVEDDRRPLRLFAERLKNVNGEAMARDSLSGEQPFGRIGVGGQHDRSPIAPIGKKGGPSFAHAASRISASS
jgi:hypothetical protein